MAEEPWRSLCKAEGYLQLGLGRAALPHVVQTLIAYPEAFDIACFLYGWAKHLAGDLKVSRYALDQVLEAARAESSSSAEFVRDYTRLMYGCVDWDPGRFVPNSEMIGLFPLACMRAIQGKKEDAVALLAERSERR